MQNHFQRSIMPRSTTGPNYTRSIDDLTATVQDKLRDTYSETDDEFGSMVYFIAILT